MITAKLQWQGQEIQAEVINPGEWRWFGLPYLIEIGSVFYIIEADSADDAIDAFADSEKGYHIAINPEDFGDYGDIYHPGDTIGGKTIERSGWYDLNGQHSDSNLNSYHIADNGKFCNLDDLRVYGLNPTRVRYHGSDLPGKGVRADRFSQYQDWLATQ